MTTFFILESGRSTGEVCHPLSIPRVLISTPFYMHSHHPDKLHKTQHASFLPAIDLLKSLFNVQDLNSGTGLPQFSYSHVTTPVIPQTILACPTSTPVLGPHIAAAVGTPIRLAPSTSAFRMGSQFSCLFILILVAVRYEKVHQELELLFGQQNSS